MDTSLTIEQQFDNYCESLRHFSNHSPQRQGLMFAEFQGSIVDPRVIKTAIEVGSRFIELPQIIPIELNGWLNSEFYESKYPGEIDDGRVMHFTPFNQGELGSRATRCINKLARYNGHLVFDVPKSEHDKTLDILIDTLSVIGVEVEEVEDLGTQTYYTGRAVQCESYDPQKDSLTLIEASELLNQVSDSDSSVLTGTIHATRLTKEQARTIYPHYQEAFKVLNNHPCRQGLDPEEFFEMVTDDEEVSKIVYLVDGEPATICILGNNLSKFSWLNTDYYDSRFPDDFSQGQILYFPSLATNPTKQGMHFTEPVISLIAEIAQAGNSQPIIAFDCCDINKEFLPEYIEYVINNTDNFKIKFDEIGVQRYTSLALRKKPNRQ